jgi:MerR family transcriptional regulator, light-induced transcriptional regulator
MKPPGYPIRAVAKITGLSLDTLRAWERRYKAVVPERSHRGRQYGSEQIERLLLLSRLVGKGHAIGGIAALEDADLQKLLDDQPRSSTQQISPDAPGVIAPILAAIGHGGSIGGNEQVGSHACSS